MTDAEYMRGYTDAQREEALRAQQQQNPTWLEVLLDPWPNRVNTSKVRKDR